MTSVCLLADHFQLLLDASLQSAQAAGNQNLLHASLARNSHAVA